MTTAPTPPQRFVSPLPSTYLTGGTRRNAHTAAEFISALSVAVPGDMIVLDSGATYTSPTGGFNTPPTAYSTGWITIISSHLVDVADLPAGTRVTPADASKMATIQTTNTSSCLYIPDGSNGIRFVGVRFFQGNLTTSWCFFLVIVGGHISNPTGGNDHFVSSPGDMAVDADTQLNERGPGGTPVQVIANRMSFERCILETLPLGAYPAGNIGQGIGVQQGFRMNCRDGRIEDCYIYADSTAENQGIYFGNGPGPYLIRNNFIVGAGENIMAGGSDTSTQNLIASDMIFHRNHFFKPLTWKPGHSSYDGIFRNPVKNNFELKIAQRVEAWGNTTENNWVAGQTGSPVLFDCFNQQGSNPWARLWDINWHDNLSIGHTGSAFTTWDGWGDGTASVGFVGPTMGCRRIRIYNNLCIAADGSSKAFHSASGPDMQDYHIEHNTIVCRVTTMTMQRTFVRLTFRNNIVGFGAFGPEAVDSGGSGSSQPSVWEECMPSRVMSHNPLLNLGDQGDGNGALRNTGSHSVLGFMPILDPAPAAARITIADGTLPVGSSLRAGGAHQASDGTDNGVDLAALAAALGPPGPDVTAPTVPGTPTLVSATATTATITWSASTDAGGVTGYNVARLLGGLPIAEVGSGTQRGLIRGANVTSTPGAYPASVVVGNLLVVTGAFWHPNSGTTVSLTDTRSTSYTVRHGTEAAWASGFRRVYLAWGFAPSSGACTVTVTASAAGAYITGTVDEFSGVHATPLEVDTTQSTGTSTTPSDGLTTLTAGALVVGIVNDGANFTTVPITAGTGYTLIDSDTTGDRAHYGAEFKIAGAAGAQTVDFTLGSSQPWTVVTAAFAPAFAGVPAVVGTPATNSFTDTGLTPSTAYAYTAQAFDAAANTSAFSGGLLVTTLSGGGGPVSRVVTVRAPVVTRAVTTVSAGITV